MSDAGTADERGIEEVPAIPAHWNVQRVVVALAWVGLSGFTLVGLIRLIAVWRGYWSEALAMVLANSSSLWRNALLVAGFVGGIGLLNRRRWSKWVLGSCAVVYGMFMGPPKAVLAFCGYTVLVLIRVPLDERAIPEAQRSPLPAHLNVQRIVVALVWIAVAGSLVAWLPARWDLLLSGAGQYMGGISGAGDRNAAAEGILMMGAFAFWQLLVSIVSVVWVVAGIGLLYRWRWSKWVLGPSAVVMAAMDLYFGLLPFSPVIIPVFCGYTVWVLIQVFPQASRGTPQPAAD